jgi:hypothetical protein
VPWLRRDIPELKSLEDVWLERTGRHSDRHARQGRNVAACFRWVGSCRAERGRRGATLVLALDNSGDTDICRVRG